MRVTIDVVARASCIAKLNSWMDVLSDAVACLVLGARRWEAFGIVMGSSAATLLSESLNRLYAWCVGAVSPWCRRQPNFRIQIHKRVLGTQQRKPALLLLTTIPPHPYLDY